MLIMTLSRSDHVLDPTAAELTVIEYGNYSDAGCRAAQQAVGCMLRRWPGRVQFVYRHYVHSRVDRLGHTAALAAEAAAIQEKFWDLHSLLMGLHSDPTPARLVELAREAKLDVAALLRDLAEDRFDEKIREDLRSGAMNGVVAVPTFFVNDQRIEGSALIEAVAEILDGPGA